MAPLSLMAKKKPQRTEYEPSDKEKCQKIDMALSALSRKGGYTIIAEKHNQLAFELLSDEETQINNMEGVMPWVGTFLMDIKEAGPVSCFVGKKAKRCYEKGFTEIFLFAYKIWSNDYEKVVYLKFGIRKLPSTDNKEKVEFLYCHLDCHEDDKEKTT